MQHRISIVDQDTVDVYSLVSLKFLNVYDVEILISLDFINEAHI
jgi:hypothetical protein